ncbi:MAG: lasso RiPP family leader peptide-containing protein [Gemmatimonadales bacterium]
MYQKPTLQRFGSLRELTLAGFEGADDGLFKFIDGNLGCTFNGTNCS